jgi:hypothetical protein
MALSSEKAIEGAKPPLKIRARVRIETAAGSTRHSKKINWRHSVATPVAVAAGLATYWFVEVRPRDCQNLQVGASFAGSKERFTDYISGIHGHACHASDLGAVHRWLFVGGIASIGYAAILFFLLRLWWPNGWVTSKFVAASNGILVVPIVAAIADIAENIVMAAGLDIKSTGTTTSVVIASWAARVVPVLAWIKLLFYGASVLLLLITLLGAVNRRTLDNEPDEGVRWTPSDPKGYGICCSGGGIRAGSIALGALGALETHDRHTNELRADQRASTPNLLTSAKFISSVSGGGYTVGAWRIATGARDFESGRWKQGVIGDPFLADYDQPPPTDFDSRSIESPPTLYRHIQARREFLRTGRGGFPLSLLTALGFLAIHLAVLLATIVLIAWPLGRLTRMWPVNGGIGCAAAYAPHHGQRQPPPPPSHEQLLDADLCPSPGSTATTDAGLCHANSKQTMRPDLYLQHSGERTYCFLNTRGRQLPMRWGLMAPAVSLAGLGVLAFAPKLFKWRTSARRRWSIISSAFFGAAAFFGVILLGVPLALDVVFPRLDSFQSAWSVITLSGASGGLAFAQRYVKGWVKKSMNRAGSVLLYLASIVIGVYVAGKAALGSGWLGSPFPVLRGWGAYGLLAVVVVVVYSSFNPQSWSLNTLYRNRIRGGFATSREEQDAPRDLRRPRRILPATRRTPNTGSPVHQIKFEDPGQRLYPFKMNREPTVDHYGGRARPNLDVVHADEPDDEDRTDRPVPGPVHLICCSAARSARTVTGVASLSFVIGPDRVRLYEPCTELAQVEVKEHWAHTSVFVDALATSTNRNGDWLSARWRRRQCRAQGTTSAAMAVSAAAMASSMGRFGRQYPTALFAAFNIRLGVWMPNPRYLTRGVERFPKPNLVHLLKELTGAWDIDDHHLYVSDGGHRENLGLVELLRRRCRFVICIDASGDTPGSFTTLRQAAELARIEAACKIDLGPLDEVAAKHAVQPWTILRGTYTHTDDDAADNKVVILHVRPVIYQALRDELVAFAAEDPDFPHYSTGNQFLSDTQFRHLVQYGREAMTASLTALDAEDRARLVAAAHPESPQRPGPTVDDKRDKRAASSKPSESRLRKALRSILSVRHLRNLRRRAAVRPQR